MFLCYIDESGTSDLPGTSSHFVLAGFSLPVSHWRAADDELHHILGRYGLADSELHTAWMLRKYLEQSKVAGFSAMDWGARRAEIERQRVKELLRLQRLSQRNPYRQAKKNFKKTEAYIHLDYDERVRALREVADAIGSWGHARLFAECIDKTHHDSARAAGRSIAEQAFEQVVSRFQRYLANMSLTGLAGTSPTQQLYGLLVHDNNESVAKKHTALMRSFHESGTNWISIDNIIETPLFVDSSLTRMVQVADLCSYALRRYVENNEDDLLNRIFPRADRVGYTTVGVRHYAVRSCRCLICATHRAPLGIA